MNICKTIWLIMLAIFLAAKIGMAQHEAEPEKSGRIEDGRLILSMNPNWNDEQKKRFAEIFDIDSLIVNAVWDSRLSFINDSTDWSVVINPDGYPELSKKINGKSDTGPGHIILSSVPGEYVPAPLYSLPVNFGVNDLLHSSAFSYNNQYACFLLSGHEQARQVVLSGSFNQWSTMQLPMQPTDSGWVACIGLPPGKYHYKYIIDGRWSLDPNNRLRERDGRKNQNSVIFAPNYVFNLEGNLDARRVMLSGSFNNWNTRELQMKKTETGWELPVYLKEGTYAYKFIVDGQWTTDPANPVIRPDGSGNYNSFMGIGDSLVFRLKGFTDAGKVILSGDFNDWNTAELLMDKTTRGWKFDYVLGPGNYEYKFIVDGQWMPDPENPFTTGSGVFTNSFLAYQHNHVFVLHGYQDDERVIVTGSFNHWDNEGYRMVYDGGVWILPIYLPPGRHSYKFIVNGEWMMDPDNPLWEENQYGDGNSVLWIEL